MVEEGGGKFAENHQTDWSRGDLRRRGVAGPKKGGVAWIGDRDKLLTSRTFNVLCLQSIFDMVYSEPPANSVCFLFACGDLFQEVFQTEV